MTTAEDGTAQVADDAFEAYLAGRAVPAGKDGLVSFADAVRASATAPGRPSAALAELLATGLLVDQSSPFLGTARPANRRRRRIRMLLPTLLAKLASAGLAAKAAAGAGALVVGLSTAGFVGALPDPAQHTFATVVDSVTPLEAPDPEAGDDSTGTDPDTPSSTTGDGTTDGTTDGGTEGTTDGTTGTPSPATPSHPANFGGTVSSDARDGGVDGQQISQEAHERNQQRKGTATTSPSPSPSPSPDAGDDSGDGSPSGDGVATTAHAGSSSHGGAGKAQPRH